MSKENKTFKVGRDSRTGRFVSVERAERHPNNHTVERVPKPGYGDTRDQARPRPPRNK